MKNLFALVLIAAFSFATTSAMACPKGEVLTGGTGKHHKGGTCAPKAAKTTKAAPTAKDTPAKDAPAKK
jgi:hypothetical protein